MLFLQNQWARVVFVVLALTLVQCFAMPFMPRVNGKCIHTRVLKMLAADCHDVSLPSVPVTLNKDIEVLDLSFNRIRELRKNDFSYYSYVKMLYLNENFISTIENDTFGDLQYLEVVNLSLNAFPTIPRELFHLTNLRKLTMDHNTLSRDNFEDICAKPAMQSLMFLSLAYCKLTVLPPLERFPHIEFLNLSGNALTSISPSQIAPACLLTHIDLTGNSRLFKGPGCDCIALKRWTSSKNITVQPNFDLLCLPMRPEMEEECYNQTASETDALYTSCKAAYAAMMDQTLKAQIWYWFSVIGGGAVIILVAILCYVCCNNKFYRKRTIHTQQPLNNGAGIERNGVNYRIAYANDD